MKKRKGKKKLTKLEQRAQDERKARLAARIAKAKAFRAEELERLRTIEYFLQALLNRLTIVDDAIVKMAANVTPMVNDLRRGNAALLVDAPTPLPQPNGRGRHG